jgi:hypothetical protein
MKAVKVSGFAENKTESWITCEMKKYIFVVELSLWTWLQGDFVKNEWSKMYWRD